MHFEETDKIQLVKSAIEIPPCVKFRYFEIEVIENIGDVPIYVGLVEENDPFLPNPSRIEDLSG